MRNIMQQIVLNEQTRSNIINSCLDAIIVIDSKSCVIEWNNQAETMFGFTKAEMLGYSINYRIIPPQYRSAHNNGMINFINTGVGPVIGKRIEIQALHKNGTIFPIELSISQVLIGDKSYFVSFIRDLTETNKLKEQEKVLLKELNHRVKNNMAIVSALIGQTLRNTPDLTQAYLIIQQRLNALASAHELLFQNDWADLDLAALTNTALKPFDSYRKQISLTYGLDAVKLNPQVSLCYVLAIHELTTNAIKYGALKDPSGSVAVAWNRVENRTCWTWIEKGVLLTNPPEKSGFGSKLIKRNFEAQLDTTVEIKWLKTGLHYTVYMPIKD